MPASVRGFIGCWMSSLLLVSSVAIASDLRIVEAAKDGDVHAVSLLVTQVDVNTQQPDGATALHWAAHWDDLEMAEVLISAGADVNTVNDYGVTPLWLACINGSARLVDALLDAGADARATLPPGEIALMACARTGSVATVKALLARGADVNAKEFEYGQTALMWAAAEGHSGVVQTLVDGGANVSGRSSHKSFTPLLFAARDGHLDTVRLLLARGADVDESSSDGTTALLVAAVRGHVELAVFLLEQGANPNITEPGYTPLHWAAGVWESIVSLDYPSAQGEWRALAGIPTPDGRRELVEALLAHGADPNARVTKDPPRYGYTLFRSRYITGATPFYVAALSGDAAIMRLLVASGADPQLTADDGTTPLMVAAGIARVGVENTVEESQHLEAVRLSLDLGNDINAPNSAGFTALHAAAFSGFETVVRFLAERGADLNRRTERGQTALGIAEGNNLSGYFFERPATAALLRALGAESAGTVTLESFTEQR